jgi:preprotein translocase subunit Sss1
MTVMNSESKPDFTFAWLIIGAMVIMQIAYIVICHSFGSQIQQAVDMDQQILIRTLFYVLAIVTFPVTTLVRYILVRLNQTMPGDKPARQRYLLTVIVTQAMMESVGVLGFVMYILGDAFNTLYIFSGLALLGFFLQRPKQDEYQSIVQALEDRA